MADFTAVFGKNELKLDFVLDAQGDPVKLGDGTFGCVFRVRDSAFSDYALKIFYESSDEFVLTSQDLEMNLGSELRRKFKGQEQRLAEIERYLVVSKGHVTNFKSSEAYKSFENYFKKLAFKVSDKAIVMDIYQKSLKDVLERGWINSEEKSGYSILLNLQQEEREKCILPIGRQIAEALSILQDARCNHQDIKPANVLLREVRPDIQTALADLGFVNTGQFQAHGSMFQNQPLGTRHYRSPEQTDFFDICEVDIRRVEDGGYDLTTQDPKFYDTFSEAGDLVVFSKLSEPVQWEIEKITPPEGRSKTTTIRIKGLLDTELHNDVGTQITINKRQTDRTDLFGLGAIIFDMLTCGRSPERFYDLLRVHDREGEIEKGLLQRYIYFKDGGGTAPDVDAIFQNMRIDSSSKFPDSGLVKVILKCMMSKPSDSYWNSGKWKSVKDDLDALIKELRCYQYDKIKYNHLTNGGDLSVESSQRPASPEEHLRYVQSFSYKKTDGINECAKRLILGLKYLIKIATMVKQEIRRDRPEISYLANIAPNSLNEGREYAPRFALFETEKDFNEMIKSGNPWALVQRFSAGGLRPPFIDGLVREGEIWVKDKQQANGPENSTVCFGYELWGRDSGRPWKDHEYHRILIDFSITDRMNMEITRIDNSQGELYVSDEGRQVRKLSVEAGRYRAYFVRKFDRNHYYLAMLGIYIRLLFFVDPAKEQTHTPGSIYFFEHGRSVGRTAFKPLPNLSSRSISFWKKSSPLSELFSLMAGIHARLLTLQLDDQSPLNTVDDFVGKIRDGISRATKCNSGDLINLSIKELLGRGVGGNLSGSDFPDIDQLVRENIIFID